MKSKDAETKIKEQIVKAAMLRHGYPGQRLQDSEAAAGRADVALERWCEALRKLRLTQKAKKR